MADEFLPPQALAALEAGNKIDAIKQLRLTTGLGLKEAKEWIDSYERGGPAPAPVYDHPPERDPDANMVITPEAMAALKQGSAVEAIRCIRESTGVGLAEATDIAAEIRKSMPKDWTVEKYRAALASNGGAPGLPPNDRPPRLAPGQVASGGGGAVKWVVLAAVLAATVVAVFKYL